MAPHSASSGIRPRLLALLASATLLIVCAGATIGLTFAPCYSSICVEHWFPTQVRFHIALFYGGVGLLAIFLAALSSSKTLRSISNRYLSDRTIPFTSLRLSVGGLTLSIWLIALSVASTAYWYPAERTFWYAKGNAIDWTQFIHRVNWSGVTGHWCDVLIGLVLLPVGRNSLISTAFGIEPSSLLLAHKLLAYALCTFALVHGLIYYSFLAAWVADSEVSQLVFDAFNPDNPFYTWEQVEHGSIYLWLVLPTGAVVGIILIPVMLITALPIIRRNSYNTFYYIHVIFAVLVLVLSCIHASTNFYFILPGLLLWVYDWVRRVQNALYYKQSIDVESAGNDWYRMRLASTPKTVAAAEASTAEKGLDSQSLSAPSHPLETYYIRLSAVSKMQIHPFTAAAAATSLTGPTFLFQKSPPKKKEKKTQKEWTWLLSAMVDQSPADELLKLEARIEGPYVTSVPELYSASNLLAIVGGTGITGALSVANWWLAQQDAGSETHQRLKIVWTIRDAKMADLAEIRTLQDRLQRARQPADIQIHVSSESGRLQPDLVVDDFVEAQTPSAGSTFVYISGPEGLAAGAESACIRQQKRLRQQNGSKEIAWYNATFAV